jgi:hypothetical protein
MAQCLKRFLSLKKEFQSERSIFSTHNSNLWEIFGGPSATKNLPTKITNKNLSRETGNGA